jgi:hypothetical protein
MFSKTKKGTAVRKKKNRLTLPASATDPKNQKSGF